MIETSLRGALLSPRVPRRSSHSTAPALDRPARAARNDPNRRARSRTRTRGNEMRNAAPERQGSGVIYIPRVVIPMRRDNLEKPAKRLTQSRSRTLAQSRGQRGEAATILTLIGCAGAICLLGIVYVSAYARVARQERAIHALQLDVTVAQAHHQLLVQELAQLQSASRIDTLASQMKLVHAGSAEYITVGAPTAVLADGAPAADVAQMASAR